VIDRFCTSGSFSGTICNIRALVVGVTVDVTGYGQIKQTVLSEQQDGIAAVGNGNSGGPVFYPTGTGDSQAQARGTISAIPGTSVYWRTCQGFPASRTTKTVATARTGSTSLTSATSWAPTLAPLS
jgi:hypothetical protein